MKDRIDLGIHHILGWTREWDVHARSPENAWKTALSLSGPAGGGRIVLPCRLHDSIVAVRAGRLIFRVTERFAEAPQTDAERIAELEKRVAYLEARQ